MVSEKRDYLSEVRAFRKQVEQDKADSYAAGMLWGTLLGFGTSVLIVAVVLVSVYH